MRSENFEIRVLLRVGNKTSNQLKLYVKRKRGALLQFNEDVKWLKKINYRNTSFETQSWSAQPLNWLHL